LQACVCNGGYSGANGGACTACNASVWCLYGRANPCPPNSKSGPMSSSLAQCLCNPSYYGDVSMGGPELTLCQVRTHAHTFVRGFNGPQKGRVPSKKMLRRGRALTRRTCWAHQRSSSSSS
jgi:hypothetical protein